MASGNSQRDGRSEEVDGFFALSCVVSSPTSSKKLHSDELWQGHYCCVPLCRHSSAENASPVWTASTFMSFLSQYCERKGKGTAVDFKDSARLGEILVQILSSIKIQKFVQNISLQMTTVKKILEPPDVS